MRFVNEFTHCINVILVVLVVLAIGLAVVERNVSAIAGVDAHEAVKRAMHFEYQALK